MTSPEEILARWEDTKALKVVLYAIDEATRRGYGNVPSELLVLALLEKGEAPVVSNYLRYRKVSLRRVRGIVGERCRWLVNQVVCRLSSDDGARRADHLLPTSAPWF